MPAASWARGRRAHQLVADGLAPAGSSLTVEEELGQAMMTPSRGASGRLRDDHEMGTEVPSSPSASPLRRRGSNDTVRVPSVGYW